MASRALHLVVSRPLGLANADHDLPDLWFTAAELAEFALPGLSGVKRKINERAQGECWALRRDGQGNPLTRKRAARGGGTEYHMSLFPAAARAALIKRGIASPTSRAEHNEGRWKSFNQQSAKVKAKATERLARIDEILLLQSSGMNKTDAILAVGKQYDIGRSTLCAWFAQIEGISKQNWLPHLATYCTGDASYKSVDAQAFKFIKSDYLRQSKPSWESCYSRLQAQYLGLTIPSSRTLRRKFERETPAQIIALLRGGAETLRMLIPYQKRTVADLHAMELVNIDGHDCDVFVRWPDGRILRPTFLAIQDVYSRKIVAWRIAETEDSITARQVFGDLFKNWGIPKGLLADNGHAFASKWLTGAIANRYRFKVKADEPTGLLTALGVEVHWALPYRGSSKPIERAFRDFCDGAAKHPAFEGAYTGNSTVTKPENYGNAAVPYDVFMKVWGDCVTAHNAKQGRNTEMARGVKSFDQVFAQSYAVSPIGKASPEQMKMAMLTAKEARCHPRSGEVEVYGNRYWVPEMLELAGKRVIIRFDPDDLHQEVHIYNREGGYLLACPIKHAVGFLDASAAKTRAREIADFKKATKAAVKAEGILTASQLADMMPDTPTDTAPPEAGVIRPVRHQGQTAASRKPRALAAQVAHSHAVLDRIANHLTVVK